MSLEGKIRKINEKMRKNVKEKLKLKGPFLEKWYGKPCLGHETPVFKYSSPSIF
jgi:hypothetical protein